MERGDIVKGIALFPRTGGYEWVQGEYLGTKDFDATKAQVKVGDRDIRLVLTATMVTVVPLRWRKPAADSKPTPRGAVLREAENLITGERNKTYGSPVENFDVTAALWNAQLGHKLKPGESFTGTDVALLMIQLKMARLRTSPSKRDHYVDVAGYAACGWECQEVEDSSA